MGGAVAYGRTGLAAAPRFFLPPGRRRRLARGVGMYPDETCFDASRPAWLPYWLDDLTESGCKINELISGNQTGNTAQPGAPGAASQTVENAQAACESGGGAWNASNNSCGGVAYQFEQYLPWIVVGFVAIAVLPVVLGGRR